MAKADRGDPTDPDDLPKDLISKIKKFFKSDSFQKISDHYLILIMAFTIFVCMGLVYNSIIKRTTKVSFVTEEVKPKKKKADDGD